MIHQACFRPAFAAAVVAAAALAVGCTGGSGEPVTPEGTALQGRLTAVHWLYAKYADAKKRPPANAAELRAFGEALPSVQGGPVVLTDEFLASPRDNKPVVVRYGIAAASGGAGDGPVLAHEQEGFRGRRFVVYVNTGRVEEVDEARYRELVP